MFKETLKRVFSAGLLNFRRNSSVTLGTTGVMVMVLLLFLSLWATNFFTATVVQTLEDKVDFTVYFKNTATAEEIAQVRSSVQVLPETASVEYISQDEALEEFKARHIGDPLIQESLAELEHNPLQASLNIKAKNPSQYETIVKAVESDKLRPLIDKITYYDNEQVIRRVQSISDGLENWGLIGSFALAIIAVLVTFNMIRLTIYIQKQEIEIMRLVGGSNWHIRGQYLIEGALYGLFAALISLLVFYPTAFWVSPKLDRLMPGLHFADYFLARSPIVAVTIILVGVGLGMVSSFIAMRRFLKV